MMRTKTTVEEQNIFGFSLEGTTLVSLQDQVYIYRRWLSENDAYQLTNQTIHEEMKKLPRYLPFATQEFYSQENRYWAKQNLAK